MSTYAVIGGTLWGNRGAEAMVVTTIGRIRDREPDASFLLMSYQANRDRALLRDPKVRVVDAGPRPTLMQLPFALLAWAFGLIGFRLPDAMLPAVLRSLRRCRALFDVSGISFHDGRLAVVAYNVLCVWPALLLGVPVVRLSQAMGPFRNPLNRLPARWVTARCAHTFVRGHISADHVRTLRVADRTWSVAADLGFAYEPEDSLTSENEDRVAALLAELAAVGAGGRDVAALVPSSLVMQKSLAQGEDYVGLLAKLVSHLNARGLHVLVMPNATSEGMDTLRNNDIAVIDRLRERITPSDDGVSPSLSFVDYDLNTAAIRALLGQCCLLITSRFHAMVAGLALGVPTLVMGWSHKYEEVLEMFGSADAAVDFSEASHELPLMVDRLLAEHTARRQRILEALPDVIASAKKQFELLDALPIR